MAEEQVRVRATQTGHYGVLREPGDEFYINGEKDRHGKIKAFSKFWMELLEPAKPGKASEVKAEEEDKPTKGRPSKKVIT